MKSSLDYKAILEKLTTSVTDDLQLTGQDYFSAIVKRVYSIFSADYVFVGLLDKDTQSVETIALCAHGDIIDNISYDLLATPCANVVGQRACCYPSNICSLFPDDILLQQMNIEGYVGVPLYKSDGSALGIIVALYESEIDDTTLVETIIQLYATRTANELERQEISKNLEKSTEHFKEVFNSAPIALIELGVQSIYSLDKSNVTKEELLRAISTCAFVDLNSKALELFGITDKESATLHSLATCSDSVLSIINETVSLFLTGAKKGEIPCVKCKIGTSEFELSIKWSIPQYEEEKAQTILISIEDITKTKLLEKQLSQSQKLDAIGQLAGGVAHDFNNMLSGILGAADLLASINPALDEKSKKLLNLIIETSNRSADLTNKLLTFARKNERKDEIIDMHGVIDDAVAILERSIDKKILIEVNKRAPHSNIMGDKSIFQNVIMNLGINASHAMPHGGRITISTRTVQLDNTYCSNSPFEMTPGPFVQIDVEDTGTGIALENMSKIFEPFFTTKEVGKGTGLGLSAVYGTINSYGGAITVYSELCVGTVFHIFLPLSDGEIDVSAEESHLFKGSGTILLVDDEEIIRVTSSLMLEELGYTVIVAENGVNALDMFTEKYKEIDLVITDMVMPEMDGTELYEKLREIDDQCKVVISSGFTKSESLGSIQADGIVGFIKKPFRYDELCDLMKQVF